MAASKAGSRAVRACVMTARNNVGGFSISMSGGGDGGGK